MYHISIIPENTEVFRCRFQIGKSADRLIRIKVTPVGLEYFGMHQILSFTESSSLTSFSTISISGTGFKHWHRNHFHAKKFCHTKVAVISRRGHKNFTLSSLHQGVLPKNTMGHGMGHTVKHNIQAGVPYTITFSAGTPIMPAISSFASLKAIHNTIVTYIHMISASFTADLLFTASSIPLPDPNWWCRFSR